MELEFDNKIHMKSHRDRRNSNSIHMNNLSPNFYMNNLTDSILNPITKGTDSNYTFKRRFSRQNSFIPLDKYSQFTTTDWLKDSLRDLEYSRNNYDEILQGFQSWILLSVIGILVGITASIQNITIAFISDFKRGVCLSGFWLSKDICCQNLERDSLGYCLDYRSWGEVLGGSVVLDFLWYMTTSIVLATLSSYLVAKYNTLAAGDGLSEIKTVLGGFVVQGFLGLDVFFVKAVALPLSIGSGLLLGKESCLVHLAGCIADNLFKYFPKYKENQSKQREVLSCSSAAGIAVAFGAPIDFILCAVFIETLTINLFKKRVLIVGGVLLSLEGLSTYFPAKTMIRSFFCALLASVTVQLIDPYRGKRVLYQVFYTRNWLFFEIIFFGLIGVIGGVLGSFFLRGYKYLEKSRVKSTPVKQVAIIAAITAFISYFNIFTRIDGSELLESLFRECNTTEHLGLCEGNVKWALIGILLEAFLVKTVLPVVAYGNAIPGGLFGPAMVSGALAGRIVGELVQMCYSAYPNWFIFAGCPKNEQCITPGMYSLLGAMAGFSGLTKLSVSLTVIMFELTGTLNYVVPSMITLIMSKWSGDLFEKVGLLEMIIQMKGYPFLDPRQDHSLLMPVKDKMTAVAHLVCIPVKGMTLAKLERLLAESTFQGYPVITSESDFNLVGYVDRQELLNEIENAKRFVRNLSKDTLITFEEEEDYSPGVEGLNMSILVDQTPLSVDPAVTMDFVLDLFQKMGPRYILVKKMGKLLGIMTKKDLLDAIEETENNTVLSIQGRNSDVRRDSYISLHGKTIVE